MAGSIIRELTAEDLGHVNRLLSPGGLRREGILAPWTRYWGAFGDDGLAGMIGCECENKCGFSMGQGRYRSKSHMPCTCKNKQRKKSNR